MGWPYCDKTSLMAKDVSVSKSNGNEKLGNCNTSVLVIASFSTVKASCALEVHWYDVPRNKSVNGAMRCA